MQVHRTTFERNSPLRLLLGTITWSERGKQNIQAKKVCSEHVV